MGSSNRMGLLNMKRTIIFVIVGLLLMSVVLASYGPKQAPSGSDSGSSGSSGGGGGGGGSGVGSGGSSSGSSNATSIPNCGKGYTLVGDDCVKEVTPATGTSTSAAEQQQQQEESAASGSAAAESGSALASMLGGLSGESFSSLALWVLAGLVVGLLVSAVLIYFHRRE